MGQAKIRKKNGTYPSPAQIAQMDAATLQDDIRPLITTADDGTIQITLVNLNGRPSNSYWYSSRSGKLEKKENVPMEWIGGINVSPNLQHRMWATMKNFFEELNIPTEPKKLEQFIAARGENKLWYRVKFNDDKVGSVYLPRLLDVAKGVQEYSENNEGYISNVVVAPHRQRQGFGLLLHSLAASYLKGLGYTKMTSDIVGMNTDAEIAVWKALKKQVRVTPFRESFSIMRILRKANVIDDVMFKVVQKMMGTHVNGVLMTQGEISKKKFQQFEMDLTDERIPKLVEPSKAAAPAA
jgi:ribosomal protein S18 acetylase RimI-like enzyme